MDLRYLSSEQVRLLQGVIDWMRRQPVHSPSGDYTNDDYPSPEVYIVKTPVDGIPPISTLGTGSGTAGDPAAGDTLGSAECIVHAVRNGVVEATEYSITVYNITEFAVRGDILIIAKRDKFGAWIAEHTPCVTLRGKVSSDVPAGSTGNFYVYEGTFGAETATGRVIPAVSNETSCTIKANVMHTIMFVPDNQGWQFCVYRTA